MNDETRRLMKRCKDGTLEARHLDEAIDRALSTMRLGLAPARSDRDATALIDAIANHESGSLIRHLDALGAYYWTVEMLETLEALEADGWRFLPPETGNDPDAPEPDRERENQTEVTS